MISSLVATTSFHWIQNGLSCDDMCFKLDPFFRRVHLVMEASPLSRSSLGACTKKGNRDELTLSLRTLPWQRRAAPRGKFLLVRTAPPWAQCESHSLLSHSIPSPDTLWQDTSSFLRLSPPAWLDKQRWPHIIFCHLPPSPVS